QASGTAKLAGIPVSLTWQEALQAKASVRTRYDVTARLDVAERRTLGLDMFDDYLGGPVGVSASYTLGATKRAQAVATLDLSDSTLSLPWFGWNKRAGERATARLTLDLADDNVIVDHLAVGQTDVQGNLAIGKDGRWTISAQGKSLDASGLFNEIDRRPNEAEPPPLTIDAKLDRLILGPGREANHVAAKLASDGRHWTEAAIVLGLGEKASARVNFGGVLGDRQFKLTTDDFGALLRFVDVYDNVQGGNFALAGAAEDRNGTR